MSIAVSLDENYSYQPLHDARSFRVLELSPDGSGGSLRGRLVKQHLDNPPDFTAISYYWGDPTFSHEIFLDRKVLRITKNLHAALVTLQKTEHNHQLWADAICINQSNITERNAHVRCMRDVYSAASQVVVHLGEEADQSETLPALFDKIIEMYAQHYAEYIESPPPTFQKWPPLARRSYEGKIPKDYDLPEHGSEEYLILETFFLRPWFSRVWVVQEVVVAQNVKVICGNWAIPWDRFQMVVEGYNAAQLGAGSGTLKLSYEHRVRSDKSIGHTVGMEILRTKHFNNAPLPLASVMNRVRDLESTDERDKIFGVLGLSGESYAPEIMKDLPTDYSIPVEDIYWEYAKNIICRGGLAQILGACMSPSVENILQSSWVPNWAYRPGYDDSVGYYHNCDRFAATCQSKPETKFTGRSEPFTRCLIVQGIVIDSIATLGPAVIRHTGNWDVTVWHERLHHVGRRLQEAKTLLASNGFEGTPYATDVISQHEIIWRTMCCDHDYDKLGQRAPETYAADCSDVYTLINFMGGYGFRAGSALREHMDSVQRKVEKHNEKHKFDWWSRVDFTDDGVSALEESNVKDPVVRHDIQEFAACLKLPKQVEAASRFMYAVEVSEHGRRALTERGYLGQFNKGVDIGDAVALIFGCPTPFLLRPSGTSEAGQTLYRVVGWAYVHGVMFGEAMPKDKETKNAMGCPVQEIRLI